MRIPIWLAVAIVLASASGAEAAAIVLPDGLVAFEVPSLSTWAQLVLVGVMMAVGVWMWRGRSSS